MTDLIKAIEAHKKRPTSPSHPAMFPISEERRDAHNAALDLALTEIRKHEDKLALAVDPVWGSLNRRECFADTPDGMLAYIAFSDMLHQLGRRKDREETLAAIKGETKNG